MLVPPLHHRVVTARITVDPADLGDAQASLERVLAGLERDYVPSPAGLGVTVAWGLPYFHRFVPDAARKTIPHDRRAAKSALLPARRFPSDPAGTRLEENDVAILLRSDVKAHIDDAVARLRQASLLHITSTRSGFAGGGFDGGTSLPKQMAMAAGVGGADLIPDNSELFLGFTSTQRAGMGPGKIANFETLGYVDLRGSDYFAQGTHMHLSHVEEDLEAWYVNFDFDERVTTAFRPNLRVRNGRANGGAGPQTGAVGRRRASRLPPHRSHRPQRRDPNHVPAYQGCGWARRHALPEGLCDPDSRRLQHARQPVRLLRPPGRASGRPRCRHSLPRVQPLERRLPPEPAGDGRRAAGRTNSVPAARPKPGVQLDPPHNASPELPRPAAASSQLSACVGI